MGLSGLKKLEVLFRISGEEGICCRVSIALSDNDGLDFLLDTRPPNSPVEPSSPTNTSSALESGRSRCSSRRTVVDGFLASVSLLAFRRTF